jgi:hypothetical protein
MNIGFRAVLGSCFVAVGRLLGVGSVTVRTVEVRNTRVTSDGATAYPKVPRGTAERPLGSDSKSQS